MNITYIIGLVLAVVFIVLGMAGFPAIKMSQLVRFFDGPSVMITVGCTFAVVIASFPVATLKSIPKHFKITMDTKRFNPNAVIDELTQLAQKARKDGLLSLEEMANQQEDPFFKQAIMLLVDGSDAERVRSILETDIEQMSARHDSAASMYEKASSVAPAFGMVGTLVGLINMCKSLNISDGSSNLGNDMGTALITTLYGCILAHMIFNPIASHLRNQDEEEILCKQIIVEGITGIQSGENPKFLRERLLTFVSQNSRGGEGEGGGGKKAKKKEK